MSPALSHALSTWFTRPDALLLDVGARGERILAAWRVALAVALFAWPLRCALSGGAVATTTIAFGITFIWLLASVAVALYAHRRRRLHRLPFVSSALDVVIVAAVMAWLSIDDAAAGLNNTTLWVAFAIAITATALRSDARTTVLAGALAVALATIVIATAWQRHGAMGFVSLDYGPVTGLDLMLRVGSIVALTALVAAAQHRARRLVEISGTDSLTRLPNRTWLLQRTPDLLAGVLADGGALTLALVDLDFLKQHNLDHGQQGGDRALGALASALRPLADNSDWLVRLSGGEFVLLVRQPVGTTWERVDALRRLVCQRPFDGERGQAPFRISFSGGLAGFPADGRDLSTLLRVADRRLQLARAEGRNRVVARD